jgi:hypothetical protein
MRTRMVLALCAALALTVGVTTATAGGGNSGNAKACQKGGWQNLHPAGGGSFKNEGDCVSYLAHGGGTFTGDPQHDCEAVGGTFSTDQSTSFIVLNPGSVLWTCNGIPLANGSYNTGTGPADCQSEGGVTLLYYAFGPVWDTTCATSNA